jgi:hypothetical protein
MSVYFAATVTLKFYPDWEVNLGSHCSLFIFSHYTPEPHRFPNATLIYGFYNYLETTFALHIATNTEENLDIYKMHSMI